MKVLFVDVGQGSCQVILLGNRRAIVIDAGVSPETPLRLLKLFRIETIERLIISHSHMDHSGGVAKVSKRHRLKDDAITGVLVNYRHAIGEINYVFDAEFAKRPVGQYLCKLLKDKQLGNEQLQPIIANSNPYPIWQSEDRETILAAISPLGGNHLSAFVTNQPNASSAIIELRHRGMKIVFAADSEYEQWRDIYRLRGDRPLSCKALTMPHHGGLMKGNEDDLRWFCNTATQSEVVVVSVATRNQHGHPRAEVIQAISASGSQVMCTQITKQCCGNLESLRPGVIGPPMAPCRSSIRTDLTTGKKHSRNVACAGTVSAILDEHGIHVERTAEHRTGVSKLLALGHLPLCGVGTSIS